MTENRLLLPINRDRNDFEETISIGKFLTFCPAKKTIQIKQCLPQHLFRNRMK